MRKFLIVALLLVSSMAQAGSKKNYYLPTVICGQEVNLLYDNSGHILRYYFHDNDGFTTTGLVALVTKTYVVLIVDDCERFDVVQVPNTLIFRMEIEKKYRARLTTFD